MTTLNESRAAIYDRFIADWGSTTPFVFDNEQFEKEPIDTPWVRLVVRNITGTQETLGRKTNRRYNRQGLIIGSVYTPSNQGTAEADDLATQFRSIFEGEKFSGVYVNNANLREVGNDGEWFQINIDIFFFYEEIK